MRKYFVVAVLVLVLIAVIYYQRYYGGFDFDRQIDEDKEIHVLASNDSDNIYISGRESPFIIKSVDLPSAIAGAESTDYAIDSTAWKRWLGQIQEMGANSVRIYTIYNDVFYNAFYDYNTERIREGKEPLYMFQGLQVSAYANNSSKDTYSDDFYGNLSLDIVDVVDIVHGSRNVAYSGMKGSGTYRSDISKWVLGYIIGNEWNPQTIAYTDHNMDYSGQYYGLYFRTTGDASDFEAMLAILFDQLVDYETTKYSEQRLVTFQNDPENDPFEYDEFYAKQIGKYSRIDAEHIVPTGYYRGGYFASYRVYEYCPDFYQYFSAEEKERLSDILPYLNTELICDGYTQLLSMYHNIPVVVMGYGYSTGRGLDEVESQCSEYRQGRNIVKGYRDILESGCAGASITAWQDVWNNRSWNTSYAVYVKNLHRWHDIQSFNTCTGILAFDPGAGRRICYVDGDAEEWTDADIVSENDGGVVLSVKYDEECVYLMVRDPMLTADKVYYIPFDVTPNSGTFTNEEGTLNFDRAADFIIIVSGGESRIFVQERYESLRERYMFEINGGGPFDDPPAKDSPVFSQIGLVLQNHKLATPEMPDEDAVQMKYMDVFETGRLEYGINNPESADYDSLADYCYGDGFVELRIPWQLLNFSDPSSMMIHDDYYEHYGVESIEIKEMYAGAAASGSSGGYAGGTIKLGTVKLRGWETAPKYHERLKQSYYIIADYWNGL